jgi:crotonobetainyl-CoA:carnitine CoA-transferase CaiB-like acyl-CoA transferase
MLPLEGITVLDLTRLLPGPYCSQFLGDFGAEVIKIEDTAKGDYSRWEHPLFTDSMFDDSRSAYFVALNRNKKSIKLNLKAEKGKEVFFKLAERSDVILEGFRPGVMDKLGLGYDVVKKINKKIIFCALTGYGQTGPYKDMAGHDINYLAIAGILGMQGAKNGRPMLAGIQIADLAGGALMALTGILMALMARQKTGEGQFVDISMLDGAVSLLAQHAGNYFGDGKEPRRGELNLNGGYACYNVYKAKDGSYMALGALEEKFWAEFCRAVDREDLIAKQLANLDEQDKLMLEVQSIFSTKDSGEWLEYLKGYDTCVTIVNELKDTFQDRQILHREMYKKERVYLDGREKLLEQVGTPIKLSATPAQYRSQPPQYGEHTEQILKELGYDNSAISSMLGKGIC